MNVSRIGFFENVTGIGLSLIQLCYNCIFRYLFNYFLINYKLFFNVCI